MICRAAVLMALLCVNGHPGPRPHDLSYGHLHTKPGYARDHIIPMCLRGADDAGNVQYEELKESYAKDALEREMCEDYCRCAISIYAARKWFGDGKWKAVVQ